MEIKAIIWDWGRTLQDENERPLPGAEDILTYCASKGYEQVVVSLVSPESYAKTVAERELEIESSPLRHFFKFAYVTDQDKEPLFREAVEFFSVPPDQILFIGDRMKKEIKFAHANGHPSIWVRRGKFAGELPDESTGNPTYTVDSLDDIKNFI